MTAAWDVSTKYLPGSVVTFDGGTYTAQGSVIGVSPPDWPWLAAAGADGPGTPIVRAFPFAFDTPGLLTGAEVYTPTVGDVLLDAWIEVDTAWDGTTPQANIGSFETVQFGWFANSGPIDMTVADAEIRSGDGYKTGATSSNVTLSTNNSATRLAPGRFTAANPIKVCVSQDGTIAGDDPGATRGAAVLYLVTCTPSSS